MCKKGDLTFKILIHIKCDTQKTTPAKSSPASSQMSTHQTQQSSMGVVGSNEAMSRSPVTYVHPSMRKQSLIYNNPSGVVSESKLGGGVGGGGTTAGSSSMVQQIPPSSHPYLNKPPQITQEIITNQLKIKICFGGFNHSGFEARAGLVDKIVSEFNTKLGHLIRLAYLTLTLKEIHENRKWNSLLRLKGNFFLFNFYLFIF